MTKARAAVERRIFPLRVDLRGRVAIVTGGSRGLGLVIARELGERGVRIALVARTPEDLETAARRLEEETGVSVMTVPCDLGDPRAVEAAVDEVERRMGRVDLLINDAGTMQIAPLAHQAWEDFEDAMRVHFWGPLYATSAVLPALRRQGGGRIVNIASFGGKVALPHMAAYCASKFALVGLSDASRAELARENIHVTTVSPGPMRTGAHVNARFKGKHEAEYLWFSIASAIPGLSIDPARAARRIVDAARDARPALDLGVAARAIIVADAVAPNLVARIMQAAAALMPGPMGTAGEEPRTGWRSRSEWSPSWLTRRADRAIAENNELRGHRPAAAIGRDEELPPREPPRA